HGDHRHLHLCIRRQRQMCIRDSSRTAAVVVHINSPGGTTAGSEQLYDALVRLKAKKPLVVVVEGLAASGGYITAIAADHIVAQQSSLVGSIGVLFQYPNFTELLKTVGVKVEEVKSGPLKAVPSPFEPADEKARALSEEMVQEAKVWFVDLVAKRRDIDPQSIPGLTDGRIYSGRQAVELKLVDEIGDERSAVAWLHKERKVPAGLKIVDWKPETETFGLFGWLFQSLAGAVGISAERISGLVSQISATLTLDGLVSVWHPASS
ncbi:MAG TPA: signal peptide peptidase SppA, partial [Rhizobiales bacterium]|nr:signal peptide peptidase SppA [Hyphomicrobiales bacterium]